MNSSWILAGVTLGAFLLFAAGAWLVAQRTANRRERRSIYWKMGFLIACGVAFSLFAFITDSDLRRTTLFEEIVDGEPAATFVEGETTRTFEFVVEHPGVEHDLMIGPMHRPPSLSRATFELRITAVLSRQPSDPDSPPLLVEDLTYKTRPQSKDWRVEYLSFTPREPGPHLLQLTLHTPDVPAIHVRVGDPLKTDGERIAGY